MINWETIASLGTAVGTLVLAVATFLSVRSSNRAAVASERSLRAGILPVLAPSRMQDPPEKIRFIDEHWVKVSGGHAHLEVTDEVIYLAIALRNVGRGLAVLDRWDVRVQVAPSSDHRDPETFRRLTRDIYVPAGDLGFWQGALRDPKAPEFAAVRDAVAARQPVTIDLLYGDHEGGQRTVTRFSLSAYGDTDWLTSVSHHWSLDRSAPR